MNDTRKCDHPFAHSSSYILLKDAWSFAASLMIFRISLSFDSLGDP